MHPLSTFPSLLTYGLLAPTLLRLAAALYMLFVAKLKYKHAKTPVITAIWVILGILIFVGLYTQIAALLSIILISFDFHKNHKTTGVNLDQKIIFTFVIVILFSLLFTGPGFFAFDLPL